jgi:hypothetical protein
MTGLSAHGDWIRLPGACYDLDANIVAFLEYKVYQPPANLLSRSALGPGCFKTIFATLMSSCPELTDRTVYVQSTSGSRMKASGVCASRIWLVLHLWPDHFKTTDAKPLWLVQSFSNRIINTTDRAFYSLLYSIQEVDEQMAEMLDGSNKW